MAGEKSLLHYLSVALSAVLLVLVLALAAMVVVIPALIGGAALTVLTQSMDPRLPPGTLIIIKPTPPADIKVGTVLTYQIKSGDPALVTHRVVSRTVGSDGQTTFITKGDNNDVADPAPVQEAQVRGTLWYSVPWLGYVNSAFSGEARAIVIPAIAVLLILYSSYTVISAIVERRRKKRTLIDNA